MKNRYLSATLLFMLVFGFLPDLAGAEIRVNTDLRTSVEVGSDALRIQREEMKAHAEAMQAEAEAHGDEIEARREAIKLELAERRAEADAKREALRAEYEARRASSTERRIEWQQDIAQRKTSFVTRVMLATIERLEKIALRIESRIAKIKDGGGDTEESERYVAAAKTNLADAKVVVESFANIDLSSDRAQENFERIRTAAAEARELIRAAHQNLMLAVRNLRSIEIDMDPDPEPEEESDDQSEE